MMKDTYILKDGNEITLEAGALALDHKRGHSGWVSVRIEAFLAGTLAGHISVSWISRENISRYYPTPLAYVKNIRGGYDKRFSFLDHHDPAWYLPFEKWSVEYLLKGILTFKITKDLTGVSKTMLVSILKGLLKQDYDYQMLTKEWRKFIEMWLDKPMVAYITVSPEMRRKGIGVALYKYASKWLRKRGLLLYASPGQTAEAAATWKYMTSLGMVGSKGGRRFVI